MNSTNELSNLSYTNKDFNSIYSELLEYAKAISYKWDPTASDESDPGIVLLKLAALIGDKDNYNIDKNVLELMPVSVTQPAAARQLFEQCGYSMKHYHAAEGIVNLTINKVPEEITEEQAKDVTYTIPMFTNFSDTDRIVTYTTTSESSLSFKETAPVNVIEGTPIRYTINNDYKITIANLDNKNRLYFSEKNVAENGIFINNIDENNFESWIKVDNLSTQPSGYPCYKFGLSVDTDTCYIEFPEDAMLLFKEGINITYITTSGKSGNIAARKLKILSDEKTAIEISGRTQETRSTLEEVKTVNAVGCLHIVNPLPILTGEDPESIDDAYRNYKRVKDTFDTLVSLKDYTDYMITSKAASNGYVCDRLNDVQHSYKVLSVQDFGNELKTYVEDSKLTAFDLTCYALQYRSTVNTEKLFKETFALIIPDENGRPFSDEDFELVKSLQHNFKQFETNKILLIKNKYPIKTTIIPRYKVSLIEKYQIQDNVRIALYEALNSKKLYFGDPISYDLIYDTIMNADERIKAITLNFPTYETYAVYYDGTEMKELRIDSELEAESVTDLCKQFRAEVFAKNVLKGVTPLYDSDNEFTYGVTQKDSQIFENVNKIETNTDINLEVLNNKYVSSKLEENENLLLTAPSYIEENNFSSYVKIIYQFKGGSTIAKDSKYQLQDNEYIVFLWKASDADTGYSYIKYDAKEGSPASLISPSFELNKIQWSGVTINSAQDKLQRHFSNPELPHKGTVEDTTINDYIKKMANSNTEGELEVLTGQNVIKTYAINQVVVTQPCCWITNTVFVDGTTNKKKSVLFADGVTEITLSSGEYFFYTNAERTLLNILGEGTKLTRNSSETFPTCNILDYDELLSEGIDYLSNEWIQEVEVTATEMESLLLGPGSQLVLTYPEGTSEIPTIISSSEVVSLSNCSSIEYEVDGNSTPVPQISGDNGWKVRSILNIDCSKTKPQEIKSHQTITIYNEILSGEGTTVSACYIQSSKPINKVGNLIDVSDVKDLEIMKFNAVVADPDNKELSYNILDSLASIRINSTNEQDITLTNFSVPEGHYLMQITSDTLIENLSLDKGTKLSGPDSNPSLQCTYQLSSTNALKITAKIAEKSGKTSATLTIHPLFKYTNTTLESFGDDFESVVINRVQELDVENNFDYITDIESPITNPLVSETFCNIKHFYNPYTICEWQEKDITDGTDIDVTTAIK